MLKKLFVALLSVALCVGATACKKKLTQAQMNAEKDKKLREEKRGKAAKYYDELTKKYPDSEWAPKAKEKLQTIGPVPTPAPKK